MFKISILYLLSNNIQRWFYTISSNVYVHNSKGVSALQAVLLVDLLHSLQTLYTILVLFIINCSDMRKRKKNELNWKLSKPSQPTLLIPERCLFGKGQGHAMPYTNPKDRHKSNREKKRSMKLLGVFFCPLQCYLLWGPFPLFKIALRDFKGRGVGVRLMTFKERERFQKVMVYGRWLNA